MAARGFGKSLQKALCVFLLLLVCSLKPAAGYPAQKSLQKAMLVVALLATKPATGSPFQRVHTWHGRSDIIISTNQVGTNPSGNGKWKAWKRLLFQSQKWLYTLLGNELGAGPRPATTLECRLPAMGKQPLRTTMAEANEFWPGHKKLAEG